METFAKNLKRRAEELDLSNAEVARRVGLSERRYAHYVSGRNEPDLALLLKIASVLQSTPNDLLGLADGADPSNERETLLDRLQSVASAMTDDDLRTAITQAEAVVAMRRL